MNNIYHKCLRCHSYFQEDEKKKAIAINGTKFAILQVVAIDTDIIPNLFSDGSVLYDLCPECKRELANFLMPPEAAELTAKPSEFKEMYMAIQDQINEMKERGMANEVYREGIDYRVEDNGTIILLTLPKNLRVTNKNKPHAPVLYTVIDKNGIEIHFRNNKAFMDYVNNNSPYLNLKEDSNIKGEIK